ncbi:hypothetical protein LEMLEM_LOCUS3452 [Lemmus lemmus]
MCCPLILKAPFGFLNGLCVLTTSHSQQVCWAPVWNPLVLMLMLVGLDNPM